MTKTLSALLIVLSLLFSSEGVVAQACCDWAENCYAWVHVDDFGEDWCTNCRSCAASRTSVYGHTGSVGYESSINNSPNFVDLKVCLSGRMDLGTWGEVYIGTRQHFSFQRPT